MSPVPADLAERLAWRRARAATALGLLFVVTLSTSFNDAPPLSRPNALHLVAWLGWAIALSFFLAAAGGLWRGPRMRALLNDETTIGHRREAMTYGFWGALIAAFLSFAIGFYEPISGQQAARLVITATIAIALLRFGTLEKRALKNG
jgi:protein-S-isoprenylcysteine O-methyltransferase Ste14